jgi:hypothetical protein
MIGAGCRATSGGAAGGRRRSRAPTPSAQARPTRRGSGTSGRDRAGAGGVTGAVTGGDGSEAVGRFRGSKIGSGGLVASMSADAAVWRPRSACGGVARAREGCGDGALVGDAETGCLGRGTGWLARTAGRRRGRDSVSVFGRSTAAIVRAGSSPTVDALGVTVDAVGVPTGSGGAGGVVSCVTGSVCGAAGSGSTASGASPPTTGPAEVGFSGGGGDATGPGSAAGIGAGVGAAGGAVRGGRKRCGSR